MSSVSGSPIRVACDLLAARRPAAHGVVVKATRVVLIAAGVVAVAAVAKKWVTPGDVYVPAEKP